jgi:hypothetical protein
MARGHVSGNLGIGRNEIKRPSDKLSSELAGRQMILGPEERYEDVCIWKEEKRSEQPKLSKEEISDIKADEAEDY